MVLRVSPESLGPITVTAHISGSAITVELASGSAAGHDAIRAVLGDLRRELAVLAPFSSVSLASSGDPAVPASPAHGPGAGGQHAGGQHAAAGGPGGSGGQASGGMPQTPDDSRGSGHPRGVTPEADAATRADGDIPLTEPRRAALPGTGRIDLYA